jgi:mannitol-1-/sugar-/sorbitol-6-phosphatase
MPVPSSASAASDASDASAATPSRSPFDAPFAGVLLDLDGTLIDSIAAVERSWVRWCGEYGVDPARLLGFHGMPAQGVIATLLPEAERAAAFERIRDLEVADVEGIVVLPGADGLLATLAAGGVPTAIVTSGTTDLAEARLEATGLTHPPVVVTASDVERGKPWPDPWLEGARRLGVDPADCLVVEDAVAGLRAARAAGCRALVAVLGTTAREELESEADVVVPDLTHLTTHVEGGRVSVGLA